MQRKLRQMLTKLLKLIHEHGDHIGQNDRKARQKYSVNQKYRCSAGNLTFSKQLDDRIQHVGNNQGNDKWSKDHLQEAEEKYNNRLEQPQEVYNDKSQQYP
ncbi:hypothetical protein D3C71_1221910 [compost metagenome]